MIHLCPFFIGAVLTELSELLPLLALFAFVFSDRRIYVILNLPNQPPFAQADGLVHYQKFYDIVVENMERQTEGLHG